MHLYCMPGVPKVLSDEGPRQNLKEEEVEVLKFGSLTRSMSTFYPAQAIICGPQSRVPGLLALEIHKLMNTDA